ncbi:MAG: inositol monophosphatase family protein [Candidatus Krumholzibacteriia bacterium]
MAPTASSPELATLRRLILPAGDLLLEGLDLAHTLERKQGTEFVTETDHRCEEFVLAGLAGEFPGDAVEAEESGAAAGDTGRIWYVDPLDGTTNFAHGYPFFCVSAGCVDEHGLVLGAVYAPYLDECYLAGRGLGARLIRPRHGLERELPRRIPVALDAALLATGFPYVRDDLVDRNTTLVADFLKAPCHGVRRGGSAAIDLCHVAAGKLDGYWEFRLRPWDTAAGTLIARECGVLVTDAAGGEAPVPSAGILAAAPRLHDQILGILRRRAVP